MSIASKIVYSNHRPSHNCLSRQRVLPEDHLDDEARILHLSPASLQQFLMKPLTPVLSFDIFFDLLFRINFPMLTAGFTCADVLIIAADVFMPPSGAAS